MSVLGGKSTFMIKILMDTMENTNTMENSKYYGEFKKNYSFLVGVYLLELFELKDVSLNLSMKKSKNRFFR
jgi:hypothetical protein